MSSIAIISCSTAWNHLTLTPPHLPAWTCAICSGFYEALLEVSPSTHQDSATMSELKQWKSTLGSSRNKSFTQSLSCFT